MTGHHQTKAQKAAEAKAEKAEAAAEAKDVAEHERMAVEKANRQAAEAAPTAEGGLLALLESLGDAKSDAMHAIHLRLVEMRAFIDQAILEAEGDLKKFLQALRDFLA